MENVENKLKLYSLSEAAKLMSIGRDNLKLLIDQGQIGFIQIKKRKKIAHSEIVRFQAEESETNKISAGKNQFQQIKIKNLWTNQNQQSQRIQSGADLLNKIMEK